MNRAFWQAVRTHDYAVPIGYTVNDLTYELVSYLGSPDPILRDDIAYCVLAAWIERGYFADDQLRGLAMHLISNLSVGLGEARGDNVFLRSFSALVLSEIVGYDNRRLLMSANEIDNLLRWTLEYLDGENDWRGFVSKKGWAHALAHTADLLRALARNHHLGAGDLERLLMAVADKLTTPIGYVCTHDEDERLARAALAAIHRGLLALPLLITWLERCAAVVTLAAPDAPFDPTIYAAYQNTSRFLRSLYFQLAFVKEPTELHRALLPEVLNAVRMMRG